MKVLEVNVDDNGMGGVYALVNNVIHHKPGDLQMDIACIARFEKKEHVRELAHCGTRVYYVGTANKLNRPYTYYRKTCDLIRREHYDCVHIHGDVAYLLLIFAKAARDCGVQKIILHSHAAGVDGRARSVKKFLHDRTKNQLRSHADIFVACSDVAAKWMYPNISPGRIIMIHNGIDLNRFRYDPAIREKWRRKLGVENSYVIGHVGRFAYQKNHEFLIRAFAEMKKQVRNAKLLLIGEGVLMDQIKEQAASMGLTQDIIFYGSSPYVNELMQAMDLFVLPSHFEGLPVVGVEAQAAGLPILFSDQITKEAAQTKHVRFLPIGENAETAWGKAAAAIQKTTVNRTLGAAQLDNAGFSIENTVREFLNLY